MKIMKGRQNAHDIIRSSRTSSRTIEIAATMDKQNKYEVATRWGGRLPTESTHPIWPGGRLTVESVMFHFALIRIHLLRRAPSGVTPWLWPFSIILGGPIF